MTTGREAKRRDRGKTRDVAGPEIERRTRRRGRPTPKGGPRTQPTSSVRRPWPAGARRNTHVDWRSGICCWRCVHATCRPSFGTVTTVTDAPRQERWTATRGATSSGNNGRGGDSRARTILRRCSRRRAAAVVGAGAYGTENIVAEIKKKNPPTDHKQRVGDKIGINYVISRDIIVGRTCRRGTTTDEARTSRSAAVACPPLPKTAAAADGRRLDGAAIAARVRHGTWNQSCPPRATAEKRASETVSLRWVIKCNFTWFYHNIRRSRVR